MVVKWPGMNSSVAAGTAEIGRRDQAGMAAADDDGVEAPFLFRADAHFGATSLV